MGNNGGLMSLDDLFGSDPEGGELFDDIFDPAFLETELDLDSETIEKYMNNKPPPLPPEETKKHSRSSDDDLTRSEAPSKRRKTPETNSTIRVDYRGNARAYAIVKRNKVGFSALFARILALESDLERIAALRTRCDSLLIIITDWNDWAHGNDERIRQVLASKCSDAIKQLVGLGGWASGNDERIRQVLASQCSDAIKLLTDDDLVHYFTNHKIPKSVRIPKHRLERINGLIATTPDPTSTEFVGPFGASAGIRGVHPVNQKLPKNASAASHGEPQAEASSPG